MVISDKDDHCKARSQAAERCQAQCHDGLGIAPHHMLHWDGLAPLRYKRIIIHVVLVVHVSKCTIRRAEILKFFLSLSRKKNRIFFFFLI